jgi:peroxiredoxin
MRSLACGILIVFVAATAMAENVADFALPDCRGNIHRLSGLSDSKIVVIAVLGTECPLARRYATRLNTLASEYATQGVRFLGLDANRQDTLAGIAEFTRSQGLNYPMLKDQPQTEDGLMVFERLGAERTPEVFVLDEQRTVRYRGRIDDQYGLDVARPQATRCDLTEALTELLSDREVSQPRTDTTGCRIGRAPRKKIDAGINGPHVTYSNQVVRLFHQHCVRCHRAGELAPFALDSFDAAVSWADAIREAVGARRMPPWFASADAHGKFSNEASLTDAERKLIGDWIDAGCPEGDRNETPPSPHFPSAWQIPEPDAVFYISDKPISVPADGAVDYQSFLVDPGFTEDKWVQFAEVRPGNRSVVHHIAVNFRKDARAKDDANGGLVGYAPGLPPNRYPPGAALRIPAGSKLLFEVHYSPNGKPQEDRSYIGLKFADPSTVKARIWGGMVGNRSFRIPPGDPDFEVVGEISVPGDAIMLTLTPHMHLRGKSFRYEAEFPDGRHEVLLNVPRWNSMWQLRYDLAQPVLLPKGTKLRAIAHYDNSAQNLSNPNPKVAVRFGPQVWHEMMMGYFTAVPALEGASLIKPAAAIDAMHPVDRSSGQ